MRTWSRVVEAAVFGVLTGGVFVFAWSELLGVRVPPWARGFVDFAAVALSSVVLGAGQAWLLRGRVVPSWWFACTVLGVWLGWYRVAVSASAAARTIVQFPDKYWALALVGIPAGDLPLAGMQAFVMRSSPRRAVAWLMLLPAARVVASMAVIVFGKGVYWQTMPVCWGVTAGVAASLFLYRWPAGSYELKGRKGRRLAKGSGQAARSKLT